MVACERNLELNWPEMAISMEMSDWAIKPIEASETGGKMKFEFSLLALILALAPNLPENQPWR